MSSAPPRKPKGYVGINHVTRGGDVLAVLQSINLPEQTLGRELVQKLRGIDSTQWYPIADLLEMLERLDAKLGAFHLRQVGWNIVQRFHAADVRRNFRCAKELLMALDPMYREGNRGLQIGAWKVLVFDDERAVMEKTTAHHCGMEEGILEEMLRTLGVWAKVSQTQCFRQGADCCHYLIEPKSADTRWHGRG